jgi:hypothetical protein
LSKRRAPFSGIVEGASVLISSIISSLRVESGINIAAVILYKCLQGFQVQVFQGTVLGQIGFGMGYQQFIFL